MDLHAVILAGGRGERFWPLSRNHRPKQLLPLIGEGTLLESTFRRAARRVPPERIWIVSGADLRKPIESLGLPVPADHMIWEPVGRSTAAAIGAAAERILLAGDGDMLVLPSDHWIPDPEPFWTAVETGRILLDERHPLVTFGIPASYPETGYGYIERGARIRPDLAAWEVTRFHEKPEVELAAAYVRDGRYYWNSGIFLFRVSEIARSLRRHIPDMAPVLEKLRSELRSGSVATAWKAYFESCPSISIDYGVMERAESVAVVEGSFEWSDLGSLSSLWDRIPAGEGGNRARGSVLTQDAEDCILLSEGDGLLAVLGVRDLIVVRTPDVTLVCPKERAQEVRALVREGKAHELFRHFF